MSMNLKTTYNTHYRSNNSVLISEHISIKRDKVMGKDIIPTKSY